MADFQNISQRGKAATKKFSIRTQMDTDQHRFYIRQRHKEERHNGTRMNTDKRG